MSEAGEDYSNRYRGGVSCTEVRAREDFAACNGVVRPSLRSSSDLTLRPSSSSWVQEGEGSEGGKGAGEEGAEEEGLFCEKRSDEKGGCERSERKRDVRHGTSCRFAPAFRLSLLVLSHLLLSLLWTCGGRQFTGA